MRTTTVAISVLLIAGCAGYGEYGEERAATEDRTPYSTTARDVAREADALADGETQQGQPADQAPLAGPAAIGTGGPTPYDVTARDIAAMDESELAAFEDALHGRVVNSLGRAPSLDASGIDVAVDANRVILRGTVTSASQRNLANEIAHTVDGVESVRNELTVQ